MSTFGELLCKYRLACKDLDFSKTKLSQERLGELIGKELGISGSYSGAAISDWERGKSKIHADERSVLVSLIKVLYTQGGLKTITEVDELLEAGNYRALSFAEKRQVFPPEMINTQTNLPLDQKHSRLITSLQEQILDGVLGEKIKIRLAKAREGPEPAWPRQVVALANGITDGWKVFQTLRLLAWAWTWLLSFWLILPSLRWPFTDHEQALIAMVMYGVGALVIPVFIGALTTTKDNPFWQEHYQAKDWVIRLYTHQGAGIGFFLGYMAIFVTNLSIHYIQYYLDLHSSPLIQAFLEASEITCLLLISYGCARLTPYNLRKAFKRLDLTDGGVFFIFVVVGPVWALAFYLLYPFFLDPVAGLIMILLVLTLIALAETRQYQLTGETVIPDYWHTLFYGSIAVLYETTVGKNLFNIFALAGMIMAFSTILALKRIHYTLQGMIVIPIVLYFSTFVLQWNPWIGRVTLGIALLTWWRWGKKYLSFPPVFWGIVSTLAGCFWMGQHQWLSDLQASLVFSVITLLLLLWESKSRVQP